MIKIGNNIKILRKCKGMSQSELAENVGISEKSIRRFELGKCDIKAEILFCISQYFSIPLDTLSGADGRLEDFAYQDLLTRRYHNCMDTQKSYYVGNVTFIPGSDLYTITGHTYWTTNGRVLAPVTSSQAVQLSTCCDMYKNPLVINSDTDAFLLYMFGGPFVIETQLCKKFFPHFL